MLLRFGRLLISASDFFAFQKNSKPLIKTHDLIHPITELLIKSPKLSLERENLQINLRRTELRQRAFSMKHQSPAQPTPTHRRRESKRIHLSSMAIVTSHHRPDDHIIHHADKEQLRLRPSLLSVDKAGERCGRDHPAYSGNTSRHRAITASRSPSSKIRMITANRAPTVACSSSGRSRPW